MYVLQEAQEVQALASLPLLVHNSECHHRQVHVMARQQGLLLTMKTGQQQVKNILLDEDVHDRVTEEVSIGHAGEVMLGDLNSIDLPVRRRYISKVL